MSNLNDDQFGPIQLAWLQSLEAHPERQTNGRLGERCEDGEYCACCLGELLITNQRVMGNPVEDLFDSSDYLCDRDEAGLLHYSYDDFGLHSANGGICLGGTYLVDESIEYNGTRYYSLSEMNDGTMSWPDIAKFVRENPRKVFYKKV